MTSSNSNPNSDPADQDKLVGAFRFIFSKLQQDVNGQLPVQVIDVSSDRKFVSVQPLISVLATDGSLITRGQISKVPVLQLGGGGFFLTFPIKTGDLGWILASDRDISLFIQSYQQSAPNTERKNNFADSVFVPHVMTGYAIVEDDADNAVLQSIDGTVRVALGSNYVKITSPLGLIVNGDLTVTGAIGASGGMDLSGGVGSSFNVNGNMNLTGLLAVTGDITATGDITPHV